MRVAVVGHVEWIEFARVERVPLPARSSTRSRTGRSPGAAGRWRPCSSPSWPASALFLTALGDDEVGHRAKDELERLGVRMEVAWRPEPQRRAFVYVDSAGERTITVIGERLGPSGVRPAALARARADGRGLLHRRRRRRRAGRALGPHACCDRARNRGPGRGAGCPRRARVELQGQRRALRAGRPRPAAAPGGAHGRAGGRRIRDGRRAERALAARPGARPPWRTPTAPATASRRG